MTHEVAQTDFDVLKALGGFVYLATPYSNYNGGGAKGREMAFRAASQLAEELEARGLTVYSPIAHGHPIEEKIGYGALTHADWIDADGPFMRRASALVIAKMPSWDRSEGVAIESRTFLWCGKPIFFLDVDTREIRRVESTTRRAETGAAR